MSRIMTEKIVLAALYKNIISVAYQVYKVGEDVSVYHEEAKQWNGSFMVRECNGRQATARKWDGTRQKCKVPIKSKPIIKISKKILNCYT